MAAIVDFVILFWVLNFTCVGSMAKPLKRLYDQHYKDVMKQGEDKISYPNRRKTQLYSRNSGMHVQVLPHRGKVVAKGASGDEYAGLVILSVSYGRVRIKGITANRYICFDKRGYLISKKRATSNCIFRETFGADAFTEYESEKFKGKFLAFSRKGNARFKAVTKSGTKAVQFVERPKPTKVKKIRNIRGKVDRISERIHQLRKKLALLSKKAGLPLQSCKPDQLKKRKGGRRNSKKRRRGGKRRKFGYKTKVPLKKKNKKNKKNTGSVFRNLKSG